MSAWIRYAGVIEEEKTLKDGIDKRAAVKVRRPFIALRVLLEEIKKIGVLVGRAVL